MFDLFVYFSSIMFLHDMVTNVHLLTYGQSILQLKILNEFILCSSDSDFQFVV